MATKNKDIVYVLKMRNEAKAALRAYRGDLSNAAKAMAETSKQAREMTRHTRSLDSSMARMGANISGMSGKMAGATVALRETNKELGRLASTANRSVKLGANMQAAAQSVQAANLALRTLNSALNTFATTAARTGVLAQKLQAGAQATNTATAALRAATTQATTFARAANAAGQAMSGIGGRRGGGGGVGGLGGSFAALATSVGDVRNLLLGAATAMGTFMGAQKVFEYTDTFTAMNSQLRLVTTSTRELNGTYSQLFDMAQNTRQSLDGTVNLYARIVRATKSLNMSQEDTINLTDAINKSVAIFGGPAASAEAALFQLSQGFASGQLRGEELNSVLEQSPRLAQAIADGMGVAVGSLRQLAEAGRLTSENVLKAIMSQREQLDREFSKVGVTVSQAFTVANNAILDYVGRVDQGAKTSQSFAKSVMEATKILRDPAMLQGGVRAMELFGQALQFTVGAAKLLVTNIDLVVAGVTALAAAMVAPAILSFAGALGGAGTMALFLAGGLNLTRLAIVANIAKLKVMQALMSRTGVGLAVLAIGTGIALWNRRTDEVRETTEKLSSTIDKLRENYEKTGNALQGMTTAQIQQEIVKATNAVNVLESAYNDAVRSFANNIKFGMENTLTTVGRTKVFDELQAAHLAFEKSIAAGNPDVETLRATLAKIALENPEATGLVSGFLTFGDTVDDIKRKLQEATKSIDVLYGKDTPTVDSSGQNLEDPILKRNIALNEYAAILRKLKDMNPIDKKMAEAQDDVTAATEAFGQATERLKRLRQAAIISEDEYNKRMAEQERLLKAATDAAWGLDDARKALKSYEDAANTGSIFDARARAVREEELAYQELLKTLSEAKAGYDELERARKAHVQTLNNIDGQARYDLVKGLEESLKAVENENRAIGLNAAGRTRLAAQIEAENALREAGITSIEDTAEALNAYMTAYDQVQQVANRGIVAEFVGTNLSELRRQAAMVGVASDKQERLNQLLELETIARDNNVENIDEWRQTYIQALDEVKAAQEAANGNFSLGFGEGLREFATQATNVREQSKSLASGIAGDISGAIKDGLKGKGFDLGELIGNIGGRFIDMAVDNMVGQMAKSLGGMFDDGMTDDPVAKARRIVDQQQEAYLSIVQGVDGAGDNFVMGLRRTFDQIVAGLASIDPAMAGRTGFQGLPTSVVTSADLPPVGANAVGDMPKWGDMRLFNSADEFQRRVVAMDVMISDTFDSLGKSNNDFLNLIGRYEGTDKGRGYNETLAYGKFTGGPVNLTGMTLDQVRQVQTQMLQHPENNFNSSAVGRYQIVRKTMDGLRGQMGLSGNELFTPELQDRMAMTLARGRGNNVAGLRNEWEGLRRADPATIQNAYSAGMNGGGGVQQLQTQLAQISTTAQTAATATQQVATAQQNAGTISQRVAQAFNTTGQSANTAAQGSQQASQAVQQLGTSAQTAAGNMQTASGSMGTMGNQIGMVGSNAQMATPGVGGFAQGVAGLLGPLTQAIPGIGGFAQAILGLLGSMGGAGGGMGGGGGLLSMIGGLFGFANGGIMSGTGPLPLKTYAKGGIAKKPQMAVFGEGGRNEAFVPLPDGKSIPVSLGGGGGGGVNVGDISIDIKMQGSSGDTAKDQAHAENVAAQINKAIDQKIGEWYLRQSAPGGMLNQNK